MSVLFPDPPRSFAGRRVAKISARALHATAAGIFTGAVVLQVDAAQRTTWAIAAIATGVVLLALDLHESCAMLFQVRGLAVLVKLALLACVPVAGRADAALLIAVMLLASLSSHAPARIRYRAWHARLGAKGATTRG